MNNKLRSFFVSATVLVFIFLPIKSFAAEQLNYIKSDITINQDATVDIVEHIQYETDEQHHGIMRDIPYKYHQSGGYATAGFELKSITDESDQPIKYTTSDTYDGIEIKFGDAKKTFTGRQDYKISYRFKYAINYFDDHDELYLNITGDGWLFPIMKSEADVNFNGFSPKNISYKCYVGENGSVDEACQKELKNKSVYFSTDLNSHSLSLNPQAQLTIAVGFDPGLVAKTSRPLIKKHNFNSMWFFLVPALYFIFILWIYWKNGRDPNGRITIAPEFSAPDKLRPAEIGALVDERVDARDISATIIDFAVRGFLKIKEKGKKEYDLIKLKEAGKDFQGFEKKLFEAIFPAGRIRRGATESRTLSDLKAGFYKNLPEIQLTLYQDVADKKFFVDDPAKVRARYLYYSMLLNFAGIILAIFLVTLGLSITLCGLITLMFIKAMPKKTYAGVVMRERCLGLREFIYRAERYRVKWQEKEGIFEQILPYAMVFGIAEKWAQNFKDIFKNPPDWYEGGNWSTFNTVYFVSSLNSFSSSAQSSFSPPASSGSSGFGSGGFSGGGFGGGGGGSW